MSACVCVFVNQALFVCASRRIYERLLIKYCQSDGARLLAFSVKKEATLLRPRETDRYCMKDFLAEILRSTSKNILFVARQPAHRRLAVFRYVISCRIPQPSDWGGLTESSQPPTQGACRVQEALSVAGRGAGNLRYPREEYLGILLEEIAAGGRTDIFARSRLAGQHLYEGKVSVANSIVYIHPNRADRWCYVTARVQKHELPLFVSFIFHNVTPL